MPQKILTEIQMQILNSIKRYVTRYDMAPSLNELREEFGFSSKRAVTYQLSRLEQMGYIKRSGDARGIVVVGMQKGNFLPVPIMGFANAGSPLVTAQDEYLGELMIDKRLLSSITNLFAVEVKGDSMNKRKIGAEFLANGSYAVVSKGSSFTNNDVVVAIIDNGVTVKTARKKGSILILFPESSNPVHKPIYIHDEEDAFVIGKVVSVLAG
ncbi:repressor LexA [Candidatus Dojkabacteria bacterium]|nr:repressor LexA [Candidatus Dojkabacteria bacterium]